MNFVLSAKDGARARNRRARPIDYEHEHHFIEHEHEQETRDVGNGKGANLGSGRTMFSRATPDANAFGSLQEMCLCSRLRFSLEPAGCCVPSGIHRWPARRRGLR